MATHAYDPTAVIVSLGDFEGQARQFAVTGNAPHPAEVSVATGIVKYQLQFAGYIHKQTGRSWVFSEPFDDFQVRPFGEVHGTVLMQLVGERRLKVEAFPGKSASEVHGFTADAVFYER